MAKLSEKCDFSKRSRSLAEREAGCPLDHCECGTHDVDNEEHVCVRPYSDADEEYDELAQEINDSYYGES